MFRMVLFGQDVETIAETNDSYDQNEDEESDIVSHLHNHSDEMVCHIEDSEEVKQFEIKGNDSQSSEDADKTVSLSVVLNKHVNSHNACSKDCHNINDIPHVCQIFEALIVQLPEFNSHEVSNKGKYETIHYELTCALTLSVWIEQSQTDVKEEEVHNEWYEYELNDSLLVYAPQVSDDDLYGLYVIELHVIAFTNLRQEVLSILSH